MEKLVEKAYELIRGERSDYIFGVGCFDELGGLVSSLGKRAVVIASGFGRSWGERLHERIRESFASAGVEILGGLVPAAGENSPVEDVYAQSEIIRSSGCDVVVSVGGGSNIDAAKAAVVHAAYGPDGFTLGDYFGVGKVAALREKTGRKILPMVAAELASASGAHLTRYSNITDFAAGQKLLIIDDEITPARALFDYELTRTMPRDFTLDGAFDGLAHCLEVWMGIPAAKADRVREIALTGVELIVSSLRQAAEKPDDVSAREKLGLGTDCGGLAIMIGGTNGAHLASFSLVDVLPHGRACALLEPYYLAAFSPAIEDRLRPIADIYARCGYLEDDVSHLGGFELGAAIATAMVKMAKSLGFPTTLDEVEKFTDAHVSRVLAAAKKPELASKLQNMPVPMDASMVDDYIGPILAASRRGDFGLIKPFGKK